MSKKIVFIGDSITDAGRIREAQGEQRNHAYGFGYVRQIAGSIISEDPTKYVIINSGIDGNRICDIYARIKKDVWNYEPDVLTILVGVNDLMHEIMTGNGVEPDRYYTYYDMLLKDTIKRLPNTKIILMEPFFLDGILTEANHEKFLQLKEYAEIVKSMAKKYNLDFIPLQDMFNEVAKDVGATYYLSDGVHPTVAGASLIAEKWIKSAKEKNII